MAEPRQGQLDTILESESTKGKTELKYVIKANNELQLVAAQNMMKAFSSATRYCGGADWCKYEGSRKKDRTQLNKNHHQA